MIFHAILAGIIFCYMRRTGLSRLEAISGALFMAISQTGAIALFSNDTLSQVMGTFWGYVSLWYIDQSYSVKQTDALSGKNAPYLFYKLIGVFAFTLALFSKEISVSFLPAVGLIIWFRNWSLTNKISGLKRILLDLLPFLAAFSGYMLARLLVVAQQPSLGSSRYHFHLGLNIVVNLGILLADLVFPVSSARVFAALAGREMFILAAMVTGTILLAGIILYGLVRTEKKGLVLFFSVMTILCSFPVILLNHVSELYVYNMLPAASILAGIGIGNALLARKGLFRKGILWTILIVLGFSEIHAVRSKALLMQRNGERATILMNQVPGFARKVPPNGKLILLNSPSGQFEYSVFYLPGFSVLKYGTHRIRQLAMREDIEIEFFAEDKPFSRVYGDNTLLLVLNGDRVEALNQETDK
jgi:hypothetical protein